MNGKQFEDGAAETAHAGIFLNRDNLAGLFCPVQYEFFVKRFEESGVDDRCVNAYLLHPFGRLQGGSDPVSYWKQKHILSFLEEFALADWNFVES